MRPCCSSPTSARHALGERARSAGRASARSGRSTVDAVARRARRTASAARARMRKNGSKICRIGWPKPSAVSCMRAVCHGKPQSHGAARRSAPVVEAGARAANGAARSSPTTPSRKTTGAVARALGVDRREQPASSIATVLRRARPTTSWRVTGSISCDELHREAGRAATQPSASQTKPDALPARRRRARAASFVLARLAEEDHAEELHHHVAGERGDERDAAPRRPAPAC